MNFVGLELQNFNHLIALGENGPSECKRRVDHLAKKTFGAGFEWQAGVGTLRVSDRSEELAKELRFLFSLRDCASDAGLGLYGFSIYLGTVRDGATPASQMTRDLRLVDVDDRIWIDPHLEPQVASLTELESRDGLILVVGAPPKSPEVPEIVGDPFLVDEMVDRVVHEIETRREEGTLVYWKVDDSLFFRHTLDEVIRVWTGDEPFPEIRAFFREIDPLLLLYEGLEGPLLAAGDSPASATLDRLWKDIAPAITLNAYPPAEADALLAYHVLLRNYAARVLENRKTPVLVISDWQFTTPEERRMLISVIHDARRVHGLNVVLYGTADPGEVPPYWETEQSFNDQTPESVDEYIRQREIPGWLIDLRKQGASAMFHGLLAFHADPDIEPLSGRQATILAAIRLEQNAQLALFLALSDGGFIRGRDDLVALCVELLRLDERSAKETVVSLETMGFIDSRAGSPFGFLRGVLLEHLGKAAESLTDVLTTLRIDQWKKNELGFRRFRIVPVLMGAGMDVAASGYLLASLRELLHQSRPERVLVLAGAIRERVQAAGQEPFPGFDERLVAITLDAALELGDRAVAEDFYGLLPADTTVPESILAKARFAQANGWKSEALDAAKDCLFRVQGTELDATVMVTLADILLGSFRVEEALEYGAMAQQRATEMKDELLIGRAVLVQARIAFVFGNYSFVFRLLEENNELFARLGNREWDVLRTFLQGRCFFALGRLEDAEDRFTRALQLAHVYGDTDQQDVALTWLARSLAFRGHMDRSGEILDVLTGSEAGQFRAENLLLLGKVEEAFRVLQESEDSDALAPGTIDRLSWATGFSNLEDVVFSKSERFGLLWYLRRGFNAYLTGLRGDVDIALEEFSAITREDRLSPQDPMIYLYFYWYAMVVPDRSGEEGVSRLSLLSKSLKMLQQRASKIDDTRMAHDFLTKNYWNRKVYDLAVEAKLL